MNTQLHTQRIERSAAPTAAVERQATALDMGVAYHRTSSQRLLSLHCQDEPWCVVAPIPSFNLIAGIEGGTQKDSAEEAHT